MVAENLQGYPFALNRPARSIVAVAGAKTGTLWVAQDSSPYLWD